MDWSYELLEPGEQRLFEFLAVFADAEISAIEAVAAGVDALAGSGTQVVDGLFSLADKSLIRLVDLPAGEPRVAMLETIREFAADRLDQQPGLSIEARGAHAAFFADMARRLRGDLTGNGREAALTAMVADAGNLRIAWRHWVAARDLEQLEKLADSLLIVNDARGWYLDTVGLTTDMLAVLGASPSSPDRVGQEVALRISLARALMATRGFTPEVEEAFTSALELFEHGADVGQQFSVLRGLASLYMFRAQFDQTARLGREILALGEREHDPRMLIDGHLLVGATLMTSDDLQGGLDHLDQAIAVFPTGPARAQRSARVGNDPRISCLTSSGLTLWLMGYPDRAVERANAALALAAELEHPFTSAYARFHAGLLQHWLRADGIALELAEALVAGAEEHELGIWTAAGTCLLGAVQVELGRFDEGLANIRSGTGLYQERRSPPVFWPFLLFLDARADYRAGRPAEALRPLDGAIGILSAGAGSTMLPEVHLLKGDVMAALPASAAGGQAEAEHWYRLAFERAGRLNARMSGLRAAIRLARLLQARGEPRVAAGMLGPKVAEFTEGFATADLVEAREVLAAVTRS